MTRTSTLTTLAVAALLAAPAVAATWESYGDYEPNTVLDTSDLMWAEDPGQITDRVYFNAYMQMITPAGQANGGFVNPNVGSARTNIDAPGPQYWEAVLGVWVDCNGDGYIGMAETAVREYSAALLLDDTLCPPVDGPRTQWVPGAHNYNNWVTELIPIGNKLTTNADKRIYKDLESMIWGDVGKPDAQPTGSSCNVNPARGQIQSTGGVLSYVDCQGSRGLTVALNEAFRDAGQHDLVFDDPARPQDSDSPLNVPTFGEAGTEHSAVYVQDCDAEPLFVTGDLPGDDADNAVLLRPVPADPVNMDPTSWTVPGTLNATYEVLPRTGAQDSNANDCNTANDRGEDFYGLVEGDFQGTGIPKTKSNWNFNFSTATRGSLPVNFVPADVGGGGGAGAMPTDAGVELLGTGCSATSCMQSSWGADSYTSSYQPPILVTRADAETGEVGVDIAGAAWFTFYAHVGPTIQGAFALPGGTSTYGAAQCGDNSDGIHSNWQCDSSLWYILPSGEQQPEFRPLARPGQVYELRDVDCFDGNVGAAGVAIEPAGLGPSPCERP